MIILYIFLGFLYTVLSIIVGFWAEKQKKNYWIWLLISILLTPFISALLLVIIGKKKFLNRSKKL
jgi:ABC-type multidrug transport system permease subunit